MAAKSTKQNQAIALFILRLAGGALMLTHGWGKMMTLFSGDPIQFADPIGIGQTASLILAVFAEVVCAVLLIAGLFTRYAAIPLIITMLVAALIIHGSDPIGDKELALLYLAIFVAIAILGGGKYSLDALRKK